MKLGLTFFSKTIVYLMGVSVITVCGVLLPELAREEAVGKTNPPESTPLLIGAWEISIPIFFALYQVLRLLSYVEKNEAFSSKSVKALQYIKYCGIVYSVLIALSAITVIVWGKSIDPSEDVTPVISIGFIFIFTSSIIATFMAVLQRLLQNAIDMKSENDLTI